MSRRRRPVWKWAWLRRLTAFAFLTLLILGCFDWFPWFGGSTTSTLTLDVVPLIDPLAAIEAMLASRRFVTYAAIGAALLIGFAVLMGPVFCGWVCPLGLLLDLNQALRRRVRRMLGWRKPEEHRSRIPASIKYAVLGSVLTFTLIVGIPTFQILSPINITSWTALEITQAFRRGEVQLGNVATWAAAFTLGPATLLILAIVVIEWISPRLWCRALCPLGAAYTIFGRRAWLRVRVNPNEAARMACRQCNVHCPMGIDVMDFSMAKRSAVDHPDCTRCGACVDACPRGVLKLGFRNIRENEAACSPVCADAKCAAAGRCLGREGGETCDCTSNQAAD